MVSFDESLIQNTTVWLCVHIIGSVCESVCAHMCVLSTAHILADSVTIRRQCTQHAVLCLL